MVRNFKIKLSNLFFYQICLLSIFVFGTEMRYGLNKGLINRNLLFMASLVALLYINRKILNYKVLILWGFVVLHTLFLDILYGDTSETMTTILRCLPILLLAIDYKKYCFKCESVVSRLIKLYNLFIVVIFVVWVFDCVFDGVIMPFYAGHFAPNIQAWLPESFEFLRYRYASVLGHYLITCEAYLVFFVINTAYTFKTNTQLLPKWLLYFISFFGVLSTGSKTGFVLSLILFFTMILFQKNRSIKFIILLGTFFVLFSFGTFQFVLDRFAEGSLTSSRVETFQLAVSSGIVDFKLFGGVGTPLIKIYGSTIGAFQAQIINEFPFISLFLQYGFVHLLALVYILYIRPLVKFLKTKNYLLAIYLTVIFIDINTFNLFITYVDAVLIYVLTVILLDWISNLQGRGF